jgi:DME family drug/metabolite transporter
VLWGALLVGLASMSWGTTGTAMIFLERDAGMGPLAVGWARLAIAAPCLALAALSRHASPRGRAPSRTASVSSFLRDGAPYLLLGLAMATYQVCYFRAVTLTGVTVAALLAICSAPVLIAILGSLALDEHLTARMRASLVMAVTGTALLVVGPREPSDIPGHFGLGARLALGAGLSYAVYAVTAKRVLARAEPLVVAAATFSLGAVLLLPALLTERAPLAGVSAGWPWLLYLGVGPTAAAYALFAIGLRRIPAAVAGIVSLLEPLTASALGAAVFGESLGILGVAGAALLLASLGLLASPTSASRA